MATTSNFDIADRLQQEIAGLRNQFDASLNLY